MRSLAVGRASIAGLALGARSPARTARTSDAELGSFVFAFSRRWSERSVLWIALSCVLVAICVAAVMSGDSMSRLAIAPIAAIASCFTLDAAMYRSRLQVLVHKHGFVVTTASKEIAILYSEINTILEQGSERVTQLHIWAGGNRHVEISGRRDAVRRACDEIVRRSMPLIAPRYAADFYAGEDLDFGPLKLSRHRVAMTVANGRVSELALADVLAHRVHDGRFTIDVRSARPKRFCDVPIAEIANFAALHMLLSRVCPDRKAGSTQPPISPHQRGRKS